jgi:intracellular multiplication protein IcmP
MAKMADGNANRHSDFFWLLLMGAGTYVFWLLFRHQLLLGARWLRYSELWLLDRTISNATVHQYKEWLGYNGAQVSWAHINIASVIVGHYLRYPIALILAICSFWIMYRAPSSAMKKVYNLDRLIGAQEQTWPVIAPIVNFNPAESARDPASPVPETLPIFAEALSPEEWVAFNKIPADVDSVDKTSAADIFARQLGPRWTGPNALPWHAKALFAAFALKAARKRDDSDALLGRLAKVAKVTGKTMKFDLDGQLKSEIQKLVDDPKIGGEAAKLAAQHAYTTTALLRVLAYARERGGVLAPAQFLWLRGVNRALWYPLNNLGRQAFHPEAAGAMAHYMTELVAKKPILMPKVESAVAALLEYYKEKNIALAQQRQTEFA